ncbi:hypothetical protein [Pseudoalteromonas luteoviolacea]|uniref:Uncharacterized protein n=1 Tax=Pseudoalteromonas luteoviolacea H33 TaxID=1365251 RepID=A0A167DZK5_9GAMM|nr:hypothetical protein [Pseudoalteromonas luteoviolacea]KZN49799.1 hypothetical protein N476_18575 [Pseudoalteromonas luteoviolacea H33]KZN77823.1 hypothetical protein N477_01030 [Pseudoalteromonas luteoviolacea H33-S]MBQ4880427.1 hypothetical protein [Pseudoalteromonas luteoviolacea]MBQ4909488.1 hypothetical protein [Pseudoalteromonas luteoviolacea]
MSDNNQKLQKPVTSSKTQTSALSTEDALKSIHDVNRLSETAAGVALANYIETGDPKFISALGALNNQTKPNMSNNPTNVQSTVTSSEKQAGALSMEDALSNIHDMNRLLETAAGVALANYIETGDPLFLDALNNLNNQSEQSRSEFSKLYNNVKSSK